MGMSFFLGRQDDGGESWSEMGWVDCIWGGVCTAVSTVIGIIGQFWQITICNGIEL